MNGFDFAQLALYFVLLLTLGYFLGKYMAFVYQKEAGSGFLPLRLMENLTYKCAGLNPHVDMTWIEYSRSLMGFSLVSFIFLYALQRMQNILPLNPEHLQAVSPDSAFNTTVSFISNTNWQGYSGEATLSYLSQMLGLTVQNFVSAAVGWQYL